MLSRAWRRASLPPARLIRAVAAGCLIALVPASAAALPATRHVLFIDSYQSGYPWSDDILKALHERLNDLPYQVELWVEYLDARRFGGETWDAEFTHLLEVKYGSRHLDLIVSADDPALEFLLTHHQALFHGVPVVFCGVNEEGLASRAPRDLYTGVRELFAVDGIVSLATTLRPGTREFVIVTDASTTSAAAGDEYRQLAARRHDLTFTFLDGRTLSLPDIVKEVRRVPESAAVIATSFTQDGTGHYFPRDEGIAQIAQASAAPVYSPSTSELGQGLLAGSSNSGARHGRLAAAVAVQVLGGARPSDLPVQSDKVSQFPVDWQQLRRWDIDPSRLPNEVIVLNRPASFYRANRMVVWSAVVFILAQAVTIGTLFVNIRRRKNADAALQTQAKSLATSNADLERANLSLIAEMQERRQAEEQLRQAQKIEAVGRLAGGIAHDFNNLLTVIASYSELALDSLPEDHPVHAQLVEIKRASERAASLTQQLLAFSRKQVLQPTVVSLNAVVTGVEPMLRRLIGEDVALTTRLAPDLLSVMVDPGQIEQVIVNLAVNARDAMPRGGQLTIETMNADVAPRDNTRYAAAMAPARYVLLAVSDSGHGMDADTKARIFEPFFTTKPAGRGTGLGLSMVYGIVKQSDGWIWVYSEAGQGTVFKIYFPPAPGSIARQEAGQISSGRASAVARGVVLVVEDEADVRGLTVKMLSRAGYTVLEAASGEEALVVSAGHVGPIDLLVADVVLPGLNGRDTATRLVASRPDLRTLYTSGYTDAVIAERGVLAPQTAFLAKPFTADSLLAAVEQVMTP